jgi:hypothetical protein
LALETNTPVLNISSLHLTYSTLWNLYYLNETYLAIFLYLELPFVPYLNSLFIFSIILFTFLYLKFSWNS